MTTYLTAGFCVAFLTSLLITPLVKRLSPVLGLIDLPGLRKVHVVPTPRGGVSRSFWVARLPAFGRPLEVLSQWQARGPSEASDPARQLLAIACGAVVLFLTGLADDRWSLSWKFRLGVQVLVAAGVVQSVYGRLCSYLSPGSDSWRRCSGSWCSPTP
jgi:UDP-GlcNAc:undecaprenyl-phosphate GlcNAc-1-phosphate transferase